MSSRGRAVVRSGIAARAAENRICTVDSSLEPLCEQACTFRTMFDDNCVFRESTAQPPNLCLPAPRCNEMLFKDDRQRTYLRVKEKTVHTPGEWLRSPVQVVVVWRLGQDTTVLCLEMFHMFVVLFLNVVYPYATSNHCVKRVSNNTGKRSPSQRTGRDADIETDSRVLNSIVKNLALQHT